MSENNLIFRGSKNGLYIFLKESKSIDEIREDLEKKIKPSLKFFEGARVANFKGKSLTKEEFEFLCELMSSEYKMIVSGSYEESQESSQEKEEVKEDQEDQEDQFEDTKFDKLSCDEFANGDILMARTTIRSGQLINSKGNIVIVGDVNPGAFLRATGSIIVMGNMRGVAHAGMNGDYDAFIAAFNLQATQLRIGDIITRSPDGGSVKAASPEIAAVKQGMIVIEAYLPNR